MGEPWGQYLILKLKQFEIIYFLKFSSNFKAKSKNMFLNMILKIVFKILV